MRISTFGNGECRPTLTLLEREGIAPLPQAGQVRGSASLVARTFPKTGLGKFARDFGNHG